MLSVLGVLGASENLNAALNNAEATAGVAVGVGVGVGGAVALDEDGGALRQVHKEVSGRALGEAGDAEPAGLAVLAGAVVAGDGVADDLAVVAGGVELGRVREVANNGDAGDGARRRGAEGAGGGGLAEGGAAEEGGGRHSSGGWSG